MYIGKIKTEVEVPRLDESDKMKLGDHLVRYHTATPGMKTGIAIKNANDFVEGLLRKAYEMGKKGGK